MTDGCNLSESRFKVGNILGQCLTLVFLATSVMASSFLHKREDNSMTFADKAQSLVLIFSQIQLSSTFQSQKQTFNCFKLLAE